MSKNHKKISLDITNTNTNNCCDIEDKNISTNTRNGLHNTISLSSKKETNKKDVARRRWGILARALKSPISSQPSSPTDEISMRRFSTFMLLTTQLLEDDISKKITNTNNIYIEGDDNKDQNIKILTNNFHHNNKKHEVKQQVKEEEEEEHEEQEDIENKEQITNGRRKQLQYKKQNWYRYSVEINKTYYFVDVPHTSRSFTAADLMGFNNTGNVCVWPSEESLAYYILSKFETFKGKTVLELGGGMSALAGLMAAKYGGCKFVHLTDGNHLAVENVKSSLQRNTFADTIVLCSVLQWGVSEDIINSKYDIILSADCLFFDEARSDLIETIWLSLCLNGVAYVMAPKRGDTLDIFVVHAEMRGFHVETKLIYDENVWNRHLECLENSDYDANIHYPILILLTKSS